MKKSKKIITLALVSMFSGVIASCDKKEENVEQKVESVITLSTYEKTLSFGEKFQLIAIYKTNGLEKVIWESNNESVALVNDGQISAVGVGNATISATFGGQTVECLIHVKMSDSVPLLQIMNISNDEINLVKNDKFNVEGKVLFDGTYYDCDLEYEITDKAVVDANEKDQLCAKGIGSTFVTVSTKWRNFESTLLSKTFKVNVSNSIVLYTNVTLAGKTVISNSVDLSIVGNFEGKTYNCGAIIEPYCLSNGEKKEVTYVVSDSKIANYNDETGVITAKNVGSTTISYSYYDAEEDKTYVTNLLINVYSPVEVYNGGLVEFCTEENFPTAQYFGEDAKIISAYQGEKQLSIKRGKVLNGIVSKGNETAPITVSTDKGSYVFTNLYVYDRALTKDNINETLTLMQSKIVDKYYVLNEDLVNVDMSNQGASAYKPGGTTNTYFSGVFDGRGHKLAVKVGLNGLFGGFGDGAYVKNTHFHFDFATPGSGQKCSGLARNVEVYIRNFQATLENLYITAEHLQERCYPIYDMKLNDTRMFDVYIDLTGSGIEKLPQYTKSGEGRGCLYNTDTILMNGPKSSFTGNIRNALVVTGTEWFLPLGDAIHDSGNIYVSYAKNDAPLLGAGHRHQGNPNDGGYCINVYDKDSGDPQELHKNYFGYLPTNLNGGPYVAWIYEGQNNKAEWGIKRYNTNAALKASGISKIGDWLVND